MILKKILNQITVIFLLFSFSGINAQTVIDSVDVTPPQGKRVLQKMIIPATLLVSGILLSESNFEKDIQTNIRSAVGEGYENNFDDYARYVPIVQLYAADLFGVQSKNHWFDQSKNLLIAVVVTDFITTTMKRSIDKKRPGGVKESFPSGHTSVAFTNAGILYQEFKHSSPLLAYSGFGFATATGAFRLINNTHWLSDVIMSAGIGILVTEIIYLFDPIIKWNPFLKDEKRINFVPRYDGEQYGFYVSLQF